MNSIILAKIGMLVMYKLAILAQTLGPGVGDGLIAIGAGIAVGLAGFSTGLAEKDIGAAAVGATAEDSSMFGKGLVLVVIPETVVLFGLVIAIMLIGKM
jgi:V/A-type H+-transporting ATPase subunit K